ncbi:hypothetical protein OXYTRIMIC_565 [Oxytricha trifallax]|uniref:Uncharacterized protein n=1 Tax=Oxytricha trifallax TaxID=1172189 RepID=A0A073IAZ6_9SPIT|nr:hypothetical protein OXYTRIMIC_565 [Oxytricha trifallax]
MKIAMLQTVLGCQPWCMNQLISSNALPQDQVLDKSETVLQNTSFASENIKDCSTGMKQKQLQAQFISFKQLSLSEEETKKQAITDTSKVYDHNSSVSQVEDQNEIDVELKSLPGLKEGLDSGSSNASEGFMTKVQIEPEGITNTSDKNIGQELPINIEPTDDFIKTHQRRKQKQKMKTPDNQIQVVNDKKEQQDVPAITSRYGIITGKRTQAPQIKLKESLKRLKE